MHIILLRAHIEIIQAVCNRVIMIGDIDAIWNNIARVCYPLAANHKLPAIYYAPAFVTRGGLLSYGPKRIEQFQRAAGYVDRILKGEKPAELPVQAPTRYETILNLKTAKALGIEVPIMLLARADEVIE